jgi:hypothetical protein
MTFPGAETIKGGSIALDCFLVFGILFFFPSPLTFNFSIPFVVPFTLPLTVTFGGISIEERQLSVSEGVSICVLVVLEDRLSAFWVDMDGPPKFILPRPFIALSQHSLELSRQSATRKKKGIVATAQ